MGAPGGPQMAGMAPGGMMPGYQGWGTNPATGYGNYFTLMTINSIDTVKLLLRSMVGF